MKENSMGENVMPLFVHGINHTYLNLYLIFDDFLQFLKTQHFLYS